MRLYNLAKLPHMPVWIPPTSTPHPPLPPSPLPSFLGRSRMLCYKSSISRNLIEMFNYPTVVFDCDWHSPVLLHLSFIVYSTLDFTPWENSNYVVVTVSIDLSFFHIWSRILLFIVHVIISDWDGLHYHLKDAPLENILILGASAAAAEFCEWVRLELMYIYLIRNIIFTNKINFLCRLTLFWMGDWLYS